MKKNKILVLIPARGGSKGILGKNIRPLAGKPLIAYTIKAALASKYVGRIVVSTDDRKIGKISKQYGAEVIKRPAELAKDNSLVIDAIKHVLFVLEKEEKYIPDIIVLLQPTSPLRTTETINLAIKTFLKQFKKYDSLIPLYPLGGKVGKINKKGYYSPNYTLGSRRQDIEEVYRECGTIFIFRPSFIKKGKMFGKKILPFIIKNHKEAIDIDNLDEFKEAEYFIEQNK